MNREDIKGIIHWFFLDLRKLYRKVEKDPETASIKPYRIQLKKLRAFLRMISLESAEPAKLKMPEILRRQYKSGGKLQDIGLLEARIEKAKENNPGTRYDTTKLFSDVSAQIRKNERKLLSQKDFESSENKLTRHLPVAYTTATVKKFLNQKLAAIRAIIVRGKFTDKELHEIRKILKDILYTLKLYRDKLQVGLGFKFWKPGEIKKVKQLEEWLGNYNDNRNSLELLSLERIRAMRLKEKDLLLGLRQQLLSERRKLKKLIIASLLSINFRPV